MIAGTGNNVFICDECIELCSEILEEELGPEGAAEANNGMATANEQALQDPATHQQKKAPHAVKNQEKKNAQHVNTKQQKKVTKKHDNAASQQKKTSESQE